MNISLRILAAICLVSSTLNAIPHRYEYRCLILSETIQLYYYASTIQELSNQLKKDNLETLNAQSFSTIQSLPDSTTKEVYLSQTPELSERILTLNKKWIEPVAEIFNSWVELNPTPATPKHIALPESEELPCTVTGLLKMYCQCRIFRATVLPDSRFNKHAMNQLIAIAQKNDLADNLKPLQKIILTSLQEGACPDEKLRAHFPDLEKIAPQKSFAAWARDYMFSWD
jgi:hypothetical protein